MTFVNIGFPVATGVEVLAPLALLSPAFRRVFLVVIFGFHVSELVLMELPFLHHLALLLLLVDWKPRLDSRAA